MRGISVLVLATFLVLATPAALGYIPRPHVVCPNLGFVNLGGNGCVTDVSFGSDVPVVGGACVWVDSNGVGFDPSHNCGIIVPLP